MYATLPQNPYIQIKRETVSIHCGKSHYDIPLEQIQKIHLTKHKSSGWSKFVGQLLDVNEIHYNLNIVTLDKRCVQIRVDRFQRYFCLKLVNLFRNQNKLAI